MRRPLRDRLRVLEVPAPKIQNFESQIAPVLAGIAESRELDPRLLETLDGEEIDLVRRSWRGGSIRRLGRLVEAVVTAREALSPPHSCPSDEAASLGAAPDFCRRPFSKTGPSRH